MGQFNIASLLDICFIVDAFIKFINKDSDIQSSQYTTFRQKIIIPKKILSNV